MKCSRCSRDFDDYVPRTNAENYGEVVYYACPHCGKLHSFKRVVVAKPCDDDLACGMGKDGWGNTIVTDNGYERLQQANKEIRDLQKQ